MKSNHLFVRGGAGDTTAAEATRAQDNLYLSVNGEWAKTAEIPADRSTTGGFADLAVGVEERLLTDFAKFRQDLTQIRTPELQEAVKLNQLALDFKKRDEDGTRPADAMLNKLDKLQNWSDVNQHLADLIKDGTALPFSLGVEPDMKNTSVYLLYVDVPGLILPDKTYYAADNESGQQLLAVWSEMAIAVLQKFGYDETQATQLVDQAKAFDAAIVPFVKNSEELADYTKQYNPYEFADFLKLTPEIDFATAIPEILASTPEKIVLTQPKYFENLSKLVTPATFDQYKSWLIVNEILSTTGFLSEELRQLGGTYGRAISGQKEAANQEKHAYRLANGYFSDVVGQYYGATYFGDTARQDVTAMIKTMINVYKQRLANNAWLSQATKDKAIVKLNNIVIKVGYPDQVRAIYSQLKIKTAAEGGDLLNNILNLAKIFRLDNFAKIKQPVDRTRWAMPGNLVNACYDPSFNDITFPAAILQAPFYSLEQTNSQNYGGIGAVIAHEISHAFDNNGAKFDEQGNMVNWWTDADYTAFEERTQAMIQEFDGISYAGSQVNGKLVISENVADGGGLSCALEAAKEDDDVDLKAFFNNWAKVWRIKATNEYRQLLLSIDVHAPGPLRANVQAQNMDDFYQAFDVTEQDGMWLAPEDRVNIW
ncbi:M13 family peptidase [Lapidilactobacillus dextrinicus]|uniref:M13 family metallopeptidase n=1 Tax=Lapidilactobacillus dextrinicus TaxID=51664 RepID=UPI0009F89DA8|nr:M13-type metalloendopeptidase [Lapidilactobacillus dextrinicus]QFG46091.1 M13 family peptidase [Lapidilactobacillus dextrinicus]